MLKTASRTFCPPPVGSAPAAACNPANRLPSVSSSLSNSFTSAGRCASPRAVSPLSGNLVSTHKCRSIFSKCVLPLPKKPLTHPAGWEAELMFEM